MSKPFHSLDDQLNLLTARGMLIPDTIKAKKYLLTNNYYNVINMYAKFFSKNDGTEDYLTGTSFDEIIDSFSSLFILAFIPLYESDFSPIFINSVFNMDSILL